MNALPKPQHCEQKWLDMKIVSGGRKCAQCDKTIVDFSKKSWGEIRQIQSENNNALCGMYSDEQLAHWGHEIPGKSCSGQVATAAILLSLAVSSTSFAQNPERKDSVQKTTISGIVISKASEAGIIDTLSFTMIQLMGTNTWILADANGRYNLDVTKYVDTVDDPAILFKQLGYSSLQLHLGKSRGELKYDATLEREINNAIIFSVGKPTFRQKLKWRFRKWFGRREE